LLGLEYKDFNFEYNTLSVKRTSNTVPGKGVYTDSLKTKSSNRALKLSGGVMELVKRYREQQNEEKAKLGSKWVETDRLFVKENGLPMFPNTPHLFFRRFCKRTGIEVCVKPLLAAFDGDYFAYRRR
jgi:integrase